MPTADRTLRADVQSALTSAAARLAALGIQGTLRPRYGVDATTGRPGARITVEVAAPRQSEATREVVACLRSRLLGADVAGPGEARCVAL